MNYFDIYAKRMNGIGFCEYISHTNSENNMGYVIRSIVRENIRKFYKFETYKPFPAGAKIIINERRSYGNTCKTERSYFYVIK